MLDWSDIGRLMDAVHFAGTQGFTTGTTNWVVAVSRYMAKPSPHEQVGPVPAQQPLTDEQIDRAIAELGLNYFADAANNRAVLRVLCRRAAHGITGSTPT